MTSHVVHVNELDKSYPVLADNIFDAASLVLAEQWPDWIRAVVSVVSDDELYSFRCTKHGEEIEFEFGA